MTDMPEKIWAWEFKIRLHGPYVRGGWHHEEDRKATAYIREDVDLLAENKSLKERLAIYEGAGGVVSTDGVLSAMAGAIKYLSEKLKEVEGKTDET